MPISRNHSSVLLDCRGDTDDRFQLEDMMETGFNVQVDDYLDPVEEGDPTNTDSTVKPSHEMADGTLTSYEMSDILLA
jgi:hypothetical protein